MAKNKWDQLWHDLDKRCGELDTIPNPTAEETGHERRMGMFGYDGSIRKKT